jgi:hypothetical protein
MFRGAMKKLQEGGESTSALDVARVFRRGGSPEAVQAQIPPRRRAYRDGLALARLSEEAFGMVVNGVVPPNHAAEVGREIEGAAAQAAALRFLAQHFPASADEARILVGQMKAAGLRTGREESLFGESDVAAPLLSERTRILDSASRHLRKLGQAFRTAIDSEAVLASAGNVLDPEANAASLNDNQKLALAIERLAQRKGPVSDALNEQARRLAAGEATIADARSAFLEAVRSLDARGGVGGDAFRGRPDGGGAGGADRQVRQDPEGVGDGRAQALGARREQDDVPSDSAGRDGVPEGGGVAGPEDRGRAGDLLSTRFASGPFRPRRVCGTLYATKAPPCIPDCVFLSSTGRPPTPASVMRRMRSVKVSSRSSPSPNLNEMSACWVRFSCGQSSRPRAGRE